MATASLDEEIAKRVIRQVEFYFSDSNLPRDNFLKKTISDSEDGMVSLPLICSFSRMRSHLNLGNVKADEVSDDIVKAVAETLRKSTFLKLSDDGKKIGRVSELLEPVEAIEQVDSRTIAASPLEYDVKLEDVESFFGQFAKVNSVRLPRHVANKKIFCGTALIEFSTEEDAEKVLKESLVYAGADLELKPKKDFDAERVKQAEEVEHTYSQAGANRKDCSDAEANYPKGLIVAFSLKSMAAGGPTTQDCLPDSSNENGDVCKSDGEPDSIVSAIEKAEEKVSEDVKGDEGNPEENIQGSEEKVDETTSMESEREEIEDAQNVDIAVEKDEDKTSVRDRPISVLYRDNKDVVLREDLKLVFQKYGTVKFIDFKFGSDSGYIRFEQPEAAQKARAAAALAAEGGLLVKNYVATLDPLSGEAEKEYWSLLRGNQERYRDNRGNRGRGGRHNRGGRHGKHPRSRENDSGTRHSKVQKVGAA